MVRKTTNAKRVSSKATAGRANQYAHNVEIERARAMQLMICLALFLTVFIGKGVFPERMIQVQQNIQQLLTSNMDLRASLEVLGRSIIGENETISELGTFCMEVFGIKTDTEDESPEPSLELNAPNLLKTEIQRLGTHLSAEEMSNYYLEPAYAKLSLTRTREEAEMEVVQEEAVVAVPAAGTVLLEAHYNGRTLPKNYTMDKLSLGELETITPVLGHLNSEYGYRDHPINGVYQFHGGVDIGGQKGDPIAAFADGTVEYIGEDKSYGLYLQIDHGNGIKSFYAHCNKLLVSKGDMVAAGEMIAQVGSSGAATGPHLHLELKYNSMHVNPAYYLDFITV